MISRPAETRLYPGWVGPGQDDISRFSSGISGFSSQPGYNRPMDRTIHEIRPGSFVFEQPGALPLDICAEMIDRFERHPDDQYPGRIGQTLEFDDSVKRSTDLVVSGKAHWKDIDRELFRSLSRALSEFKVYYPFFAGPFKDDGYAIQRTEPDEFYHWHIDGGSHQFAARQLVAIWYLNDPGGAGGETEFEYQDISVVPETGKLLLFPPFWTHRHRGKTLEDGRKYIATTWVVFA